MAPTLSVPRSVMGRRALLPILEAATRIAEDWLRAHPEAPPLYESGARWAPEPPGEERWEPPPVVLARGWGDCDDLAPWRAAERRIAGDELARADTYVSRVYPDGRRLWHAIVVRGDGTVEDPSARLGMRTHPGHYSDGRTFVPQAAMGGPLQVTIRHDTAGEATMSTIRWEVRRTADGYEGSIEIPWPESGGGRARLSHFAQSPGEALEGAVYCAEDLCGAADELGFLNLGELIPGIVSTVADTARSIARTVSGRRGGGEEAARARARALPPELGDYARTVAMRPGGIPYGGAIPYGPAYAPPMYAPAYAVPRSTGWGPPVVMGGGNGWTF